MYHLTLVFFLNEFFFSIKSQNFFRNSLSNSERTCGCCTQSPYCFLVYVPGAEEEAADEAADEKADEDEEEEESLFKVLLRQASHVWMRGKV